MKIKEVIFHLNNVFDGKPWYGKSISEILSRIKDPDDEMRKIMAHMLAWREFALLRVKGKDYSIQLDTLEDWPEADDLAVDEVLKRMRAINRELISELSSREDSWLRDRAVSSEYNFQFLLEGIIQHDIYHLGQIAILHKKK